MLRVTVERLAEDGTAPELLHQILIRRRPATAESEHSPVDVRLSRNGQAFTATAVADWDGHAVRRETDTLGVLVDHQVRHPLLTVLEALRVLYQRLRYRS